MHDEHEGFKAAALGISQLAARGTARNERAGKVMRSLMTTAGKESRVQKGEKVWSRVMKGSGKDFRRAASMQRSKNQVDFKAVGL